LKEGVRKVIKIDILKDKIPESEVIIMKSAQHEFKNEYLYLIHKKIFSSLKDD